MTIHKPVSRAHSTSRNAALSPRSDFVRDASASHAAHSSADVAADARPALTLVMGPAGAGKTEWALRRFEACARDGKRALLIVSSPQQAQTRAEQLATRLDCGPKELLPCLLTFRQLTAQLAEAELVNNGSDAQTENAPSAPRAIGRAFQRLALAGLFPNVIRPDDFLGRMLRAPGFVPACVERLREWKLAGLTPDVLARSGPIVAHALSDPTFARKAEELARLFHAYEDFLARNGMRDEEDCLRLAGESLQTGTASLVPAPACILVDGFYRFNPMQRRLLAALSQHGLQADGNALEVAVTLPYETRRPLLFAAPARTLQLLRSEFACRETFLTFTSPTRPPALARLSDNLFQGQDSGFRIQDSGGREEEEKKRRREEEEKTQDRSQKLEHRASTCGQTPNTEHPTPNTPTLQLFDAPNPYVEAEMVARDFRRLYDTGQYVWSDFAIVLRAMGDYAPILAAVFERHNIPLGVDGPETLAENPFIKTLLHLLNVVRYGWRRDDVLAFLKSSYTAPDKLEADSLRRLARQQGVREGREHWLVLVADSREEKEKRRKGEKEKSEDKSQKLEEGELSTLNSQLSTNPLSTLAETLHSMAYFDALLTRDRQDPRHFAALIEDIIPTFGLQERIAQGEPTRQERDCAAWQAAQDVLQALAQMAVLSGRATLSFAQFHDELLSVWQTASSIATAEGDLVRVAEPYDARERPLKVAAVMGLTERVFPRRIMEDPFLRDAERVALRQWAELDLEEQKGRADDERFLFYLAVTAPSERLILSYPRSADESDTLPSFYLDEVRAVFEQRPTPDTEYHTSACEQTPVHPKGRTPAGKDNPLSIVSRTLADVAPRLSEAVSQSDRLLAACATLFDPGSGQVQEGELSAAVKLMQTCMRGERNRRVVQRIVESRDLPHLPRLQAEQLRRAFATSRTVFSVTELESYGRCPFQYFLRHVLRMRPDEDGASARAQGTLLHAVLRRYFRERTEGETREQGDKERNSSSTPNIRETLQRILAEMLAQERWDVSRHQMQIMQRMLSDSLDGFALREEQFSAQWGMKPAHFELAFGVGARLEWEDEEERAMGTGEAEAEGTGAGWHDAASCVEPLLLNVTDGGLPVAVCGTLDRVDVDETGRRALLMDYKLGSPPEFAAIQRGQSLQMPLYLLAIERLFNKVGAVACYDSARERGRRRFHRSEHVSPRQFAPLPPLEDGTSVTPLNRAQYTDLLKTAEATAVRLARAIVDGNIEATPGDHCRTCAYGDVCRTTLLGGHDGEILPILNATTRGDAP